MVTKSKFTKLTGAEYPIRQVVKSLIAQKVKHVRGNRFTVWAAGGQHKWVQKLASDFGLRASSEAPPAYQTALCGANILNKMAHTTACKSCRQLAGKPPTKTKTTTKRRRAANTKIVDAMPGLRTISQIEFESAMPRKNSVPEADVIRNLTPGNGYKVACRWQHTGERPAKCPGVNAFRYAARTKGFKISLGCHDKIIYAFRYADERARRGRRVTS